MASKGVRVKNKHAAPVQITAEQILREANERQIEHVAPKPDQNISDPEELAELRLEKRKIYEDNIRKNRGNVGNWIKYALWEESQGEIERARSVFERGLDADHRASALWIKYAEMEMKHRQVNHARNIYDRAVTILPRVDTFWYKYTYMEEKIENIAGARAIFERWMEWHPVEQAWNSYINMELRYNQVENARAVYERYILCHMEPAVWIKYAKFEVKYGEIDKARSVYERAVEFFGEDNISPELLVSFAQFEERQKEYERARTIYKYGLDRIPKEAARELFDAFTAFEKKYGDRKGVDSVILNKRQFQYEKEVEENPHNYDAWFDYIRLAESSGDVDKARDVYERAIANVPLVAEKRYWRRYIYLWIYYAVFEELDAKDMERTRAVYKACIDLIPHKSFTFAKIWLLAAQFEIRQKRISSARKLLGRAIGMCPKDKLFKGYIEIELQLREFDRCRTLYDKYLEFNASNCQTWTRYAELETVLGDEERARGIYELAVAQPLLDMPEVLWKAYIDFEHALGETDRVRLLYDRLLEKTNHVKVWISYAEFEAAQDEEDSTAHARHIFEQAHQELSKGDDKQQRKMLLDAWLSFERSCGADSEAQKVVRMLPRQVKKRRELVNEEGQSDGWEEYWDLVFPDEETKPHLKLLQKAQDWKRKMMEMQQKKKLMQQQEQEEEEDGDKEEEEEKNEEKKEQEAEKDEQGGEDDNSSKADETRKGEDGDAGAAEGAAAASA
ncbi:crooked neck protein [Salpingoeca rosetta]|uniref:Crooked neck protein n=1 Tax=Salpingoeca rosetta (strain ATCC 50818 / BSB-021) TaxID=946362 RepID=F2UIX0_SALR5|nr:crooked neck protein [Salpingoeca rosetta]EGD77169.1 crooked neck protein [Salpingoeca rosetta]|eukprot:XP_004991008.1 crooked neck protein [Salpingoeca rosetta]